MITGGGVCPKIIGAKNEKNSSHQLFLTRMKFLLT